MSISTVKFLLLPFSCLTGATPLTCGPLPLTNVGEDGDDVAAGSSSTDVLFDGDDDDGGGVDTAAVSLPLTTLSGAGLLTTSAGCGDGNDATSSSAPHALVSHKQIISSRQTGDDIILFTTNILKATQKPTKKKNIYNFQIKSTNQTCFRVASSSPLVCSLGGTVIVNRS